MAPKLPPELPQRSIYDELGELGFRRFAVLLGRELCMEAEVTPAPAVYVAVIDDSVFWVGETGNARRRFSAYRRWLALPDDSPRTDVRTRNQLLDMTGGRTVTFFLKKPMTVWSDLTAKNYAAHRVEETILIDHFQPAWNTRHGGRSRG